MEEVCVDLLTENICTLLPIKKSQSAQVSKSQIVLNFLPY